MVPTLLLLATLAAGPPGGDEASTRATRPSSSWRGRDRALRGLEAVDWHRHPEVASTLADALRRDDDARVRAGAARVLGRMVVDLPSSHVALADAARSDPARSVRKEAARALAAKGRRCVVDCPLCGPLPRNSVIIGPTIRLPAWVGPAAPPAGSSLPDPLPPQR